MTSVRVRLFVGRYQDREDFFALFNDGLLHAKPATFGTKYVFKRIDPVLQVRLGPSDEFEFLAAHDRGVFCSCRGGPEGSRGSSRGEYLRSIDRSLRGGCSGCSVRACFLVTRDGLLPLAIRC